MSGVEITKGQLGANTIASSDKTAGFVVSVVSKPSGMTLGNVYKFYNIKDVEEMGITKDFDHSIVHHQISEFYRMAGEGSVLFLMLVSGDVSMVDMLDVDQPYAKKLINEADGEIRKLALGLTLTIEDTPSVTSGLNDDVFAAIPKAQAFADWCYENHRPLNIFLEGRDYADNAATVADLTKIPDTKAPKVSVVIGQDYKLASDTELPSYYGNYAAVGNVLGCSVKGKINQNLGENESMNITDAGKDAFLIGGLSSHTPIKDVESDWEILDAKGYIFPIREVGLAGLRWNNDHTCVEQILDAEGNINEHTVAYGATIDKASRLLRTALLPKVKTVQPVDPKTGKLPVGVVKYFEGLGNTVFEKMKAEGEISEGKTTIDPNSNLLTGDKALIASFELVPYGTINKIKGSINLKNNL